MLISMARRNNLPVVIITYYSPILRHSSGVNLDENLANSPRYQKNVCAIVIDEAHCILEW
jgi:superfamily II DNA helicase RecQ